MSVGFGGGARVSRVDSTCIARAIATDPRFRPLADGSASASEASGSRSGASTARRRAVASRLASPCFLLRVRRCPECSTLAGIPELAEKTLSTCAYACVETWTGSNVHQSVHQSVISLLLGLDSVSVSQSCAVSIHVHLHATPPLWSERAVEGVRCGVCGGMQAAPRWTPWLLG